MSPRFVRNFWLDAQIDGRRTSLSGGPSRTDGGLLMSLDIREAGAISENNQLSVECRHVNGHNVVTIRHNGKEVYSYKVKA